MIEPLRNRILRPAKLTREQAIIQVVMGIFFMLFTLVAILQSGDVLRACWLAAFGILVIGQGLLAVLRPHSMSPAVQRARAALAVLGLVAAVLILIWIVRTIME